MKYARFLLLSILILAGTSCERHDAKELGAFEETHEQSAIHEAKTP